MVNKNISFGQVTRENEQFFYELAPKECFELLENDYARMIAAIIDNEPVGIVYFDIVQTVMGAKIYIYWIFTAIQYRRQGVASGLIYYIKDVALKSNVCECIFKFSEQSASDEFEEFINSIDLVNEQSDIKIFVHSVRELKEHASFKIDCAETGATSLLDVTNSEYVKFAKKISKEMTLDLSIDMLTNINSIDRKISSVHWSKSGIIDAALLVYTENKGMIFPLLLLNGNENQKVLLNVIVNSFVEMCRNYEDETLVCLLSANSATEPLIKYLFPNLEFQDYHELCIRFD